MSEQGPPAAGPEERASNAETVIPAPGGEGGAGTSGGREDPDPEAMTAARRHADVIEAHSEPAADDQGTRPGGTPDASSEP